MQAGDIRLEALYARCGSRSEIVATFISVLELCSIGSVILEGEEGNYTLKFAGGEIEDILERIVE